ncbi:helix-turn-helix transcriptional regulator [Cellulomonas sp. 179-A 9B4 NHS]|uniref:helix-turn-helix transcriptional regulator n=1 Tax=Cellulomonas sp. 179-A 9B4 NHS TaxID=3142379 RepID=UPI0039A1F404
MQSETLNARSLTLLGQAIRRLRLRRSLTQVELARRAGVSRQWLISIEQGQINGPDLGLVMRLLDELDASLAVRVDAGES